MDAKTEVQQDDHFSIQRLNAVTLILELPRYAFHSFPLAH